MKPATAILRLCEGIATAREGILMPQGSILRHQESSRTLHGSILTPKGSILMPHGSILACHGSILMPQGSLLACQASIRMPRAGIRPRHAPPLSLLPWPIAGRAGELERHAAPAARDPAGPAGRPTSRRGTAGVRHRFSITRNTLRIIESIESGLDPEQISRIKSGDIRRTVRDQIDEHTKPLGLRKFLRIEDKLLSIAPSRGGVGS